MEMFKEMGRFVILMGVMLVLIGVAISFGDKFFPWLGKLPGDISWKSSKGNFRIYFPLGTSILLSVVLTLLLNLIAMIFFRK